MTPAGPPAPLRAAAGDRQAPSAGQAADAAGDVAPATDRPRRIVDDAPTRPRRAGPPTARKGDRT